MLCAIVVGKRVADMLVVHLVYMLAIRRSPWATGLNAGIVTVKE
jgi:hypothetical protein